MAGALEVKELTKVIKESILVDRLTFSVQEGETFGLLGSNGSGKTTTFRMLAGLMGSSSGKITILGKDRSKIDKKRPEVGFVTQNDSIYETLTVNENLEFFASQYGLAGKETKIRIDELLEQMALTNKKHTLAAELSGGMKKRLNIACSLIHDPKVILLDEPTVGLDPVVRKDIWRVIEKLHDRKKTVIITSHYMDEIEHLCGRVAIMFGGRIVDSGTPEELKKKYKLKQMEDVFAHLVKPEGSI